MPKQPSAFALALPTRDGDMPAAQWRVARYAMRSSTGDSDLAVGFRRVATSRGSRACREDLAAPPSRRLSEFATAATLFPGLAPVPTRAFPTHLPALDLFPTSLWAQLAGRRLRRATTCLLLGCDPAGYRPLQRAVAEYLVASRGVKCVPEQVVIVSGTQEALDLAARLFLDPGDRVCVENPGYVGARRAFEAVGARVTGTQVDDEGARIPPARLAGVRLVYLTPGHQFPLGVCMSLSRRPAMLEWARRAGAILFEDDYDSEYRYAGKPVPALQGSIGMAWCCSRAASARCCSPVCGSVTSSSRRTWSSVSRRCSPFVRDTRPC